MRNIIVESIESEIERLLEEMAKVDVNSEDYEKLINRVNELYSTIHKETELELSFNKIEVDSTIARDESCAKHEELKQSKLWNGVKIGAEVIGVVAPLVFYGVWMNRGLEYEKEGSYTSTTFKGLIGKFKPTK